jgi:hypothetical protein
VKLHDHCFKLSTTAAHKNTSDKSSEHKQNVDKAAARINEAAAIHNNGQFPNAGGGTGSIQQVCTSFISFLFYFIVLSSLTFDPCFLLFSKALEWINLSHQSPSHGRCGLTC